MNETSGNTAANSATGGTAGAVTGTASWVGGIINNAFGFDGSSYLFVPNYTKAKTAISGSAAEKDPDASQRELSFSYLMRVLIEPATNSMVSFSEITAGQFDAPLQSLYELRLTFAYPYTGGGKSPPRSQSFRSLATRKGDSIQTNVWFLGGVPQEYYFFTPE